MHANSQLFVIVRVPLTNVPDWSVQAVPVQTNPFS